MRLPKFEYIHLPRTYLRLLKSSLFTNNTSEEIFKIIGEDRALYLLLETSFREFDDGRGLGKLVTALGWQSFRDRIASLYIHKAYFNHYPQKTSLEILSDISSLDLNLQNHCVHSYSRGFLFGFYLKMLKIKQKKFDSENQNDLIPKSVLELLALSKARSEKIDWLILTLWHFENYLGFDQVLSFIENKKLFSDIYQVLDETHRVSMTQNMLFYASSISEGEIFWSDRV